MAWHKIREGYWKSQPCGSGREDRKDVYVKPKWVWAPDVNNYMTENQKCEIEKTRNNIAFKQSLFSAYIIVLVALMVRTCQLTGVKQDQAALAFLIAALPLLISGAFLFVLWVYRCGRWFFN